MWTDKHWSFTFKSIKTHKMTNQNNTERFQRSIPCSIHCMPPFFVASARSRDHFYLLSSSFCSKFGSVRRASQSRRFPFDLSEAVTSNFRRRKSNRIYNLLVLEDIFWHKSHPASVFPSSHVKVEYEDCDIFF